MPELYPCTSCLCSLRYVAFVTGDIYLELKMCITVTTLPNTKALMREAENILYKHLSLENTITKLSQCLSEVFRTSVDITDVKEGSIQMDLLLKNFYKVEYMNDLSDEGVLTNLIDSWLMTEEIISCCQADDCYGSLLVTD